MTTLKKKWVIIPINDNKLQEDPLFVYLFPHTLLSLLKLTVCFSVSNVTAKLINIISPIVISFGSEGLAALILKVQFYFPQLEINDSKGIAIFVLLRTKVKVSFLILSSCSEVQWAVMIWRAEAVILQPVESEIC